MSPDPTPDPIALAELLRRLAHDLRSPLGVVTEALAAIRTDLAAELTDEHRLLGALADRGLGRLGHLADTISLAAALESGSFALRRAPLDLVALVRAAAAAAVVLEPRREVTLTCELPDGPCPLEADADRLSIAISEIVINAVRHAHRRARVRLDLASDEVAREARVVIDDDGRGVPDEQRATLFRRFVPLASRSGLGLGLSIAHDVIVAHGGRVTLEASTLAAGPPRDDRLRLRDLAADDWSDLMPQSIQSQSAHRVLLVEDHADSAELLRILLGRHGFAVTVAGSVRTALAAAFTEPVDVLVSDMDLPDGSGINLLRRLRAQGSLPAIALSGLDGDAEVDSAREAGFNEYLGKPVSIEQLVDALRRVSGSGAEET